MYNSNFHKIYFQHPKQVTYLLVGPLTNFALCLKVYSDFASKVKSVFIMGGNIQGIGNTTKSAEFNFYNDPEAAHIVLSETNFEINILPWETCLRKTFVVPLNWRLKVLGLNEHKAVEFLNEVEKKQYNQFGCDNWTVCDALVAAACLFPKCVLGESLWNCEVELHGGLTRGQLVLDHLKASDCNVRIIEEIDAKLFKQIALWSIDHKDRVEF